MHTGVTRFTSAQTLTNLEFFKWMFDTYGMRRDIYSLDMGNIDDGPYTAGVGRLIPYHYGNLQSTGFGKQFPNGFAPIASNLFFEYAERPAIRAFTNTFTLDRVAPGSYLAVAIDGDHGHERAWAALPVNGRFVGAPDRAVSFDSNTWEYYNVELDHDYTYYFPVNESFVGQEIEAWVLVFEGGSSNVKPEVWTTAYPIPWVRDEQ